MSTPAENTTVPEPPIFDPFPQTNTMPAGWDLSSFMPDSAPAPVAPADDVPEA